MKYLKYLLLLLWHPFWWTQLLIPRSKSIWVFGAWYGTEYSDNSRALFEYITKFHPEIKAYWLTRNKEILTKVHNSFAFYSLKGIIIALRCRVVIISSGRSDINPYFINGAKVIQLWHGSPMKKIGLDDKYHNSKFANFIFRSFFPFLYNYNQFAVVSTGEKFNSFLSSAFNCKRILLSGYPRNDILFDNGIDSRIMEINRIYNNPLKIAYLPTFRDHDKNFNAFEKYIFQEDEWNKYLESSNSVLITNNHYAAEDSKYKKSSIKRIINFSRVSDQNLNLILKDIDILITDYSGVYFDFLLLNKPVILAAFDLTEYQQKSRELYFNYEKDIKGLKCSSWKEVLNGLKENKFELFDREYIKKFNQYIDGKSSHRLTNLIKKLA